MTENDKDDSEQYRGGRGSQREGYKNRGPEPNKRVMGPGGRRKGYARDPDDDRSVIVDEVAINDLIKHRSQAQFKRDYDLADKIRDDLNQLHGVYVWDKDSLWTTSSLAPRQHFQPSQQKYQDFITGKPRREFGRHGHDYIQIGVGINTDHCPLTLHEIHQLLANRLQFKLAKKYTQADEIQNSLYQNGVRIHDKLRQWRADGHFFQDLEEIVSGKKYTIHQFSTTPDEHLSAHIQTLVEAREDSRSDHDYITADQIRDQLWKTYRVAVDDASRTWSVGGDFGPNGTFRWTDDGPINPRVGVDPTLTKDWRKFGAYNQSTSSEKLHDPDVKEEIENLVHDRLEAKRVKDYSVADEIRDHLYEMYNISVDDKLRQWSVGGDFGIGSRNVRETSPTAPDGKKQSSFVRVYNHRGGNGILSDADVVLVEALVQRFAEERARYNKQAAGSICNGLKRKYSVVIDNVNGEWYVQGDEYVLSHQYKGALPTVIENARGEIEAMIRERSQAKAKKNVERADEIESDLMATYKIEMEDRLKEWTILEDVGAIKFDDNHDIFIGSQDTVIPSDNFAQDDSNIDFGIDYPMVDSVPGQEEEMTVGEGGKGIKEGLNFFDDEATLSTLTVPLLKEKLRAAGLRVSGRKAELIQRILQNQY